MTLTELANRFRSDKGTQFGAPPHRYTQLYDLLFWPHREQSVTVLELGLAVGGPEVGAPVERVVPSPSVNMWLTYFPNAHIIGFDISDFSHIKHPRFTFIRGDAGIETDIQHLAASASAFDIIIDDASHASYHQQLAFKILFPKLAPGGLYVIEDVHWQPTIFENTLPRVPKTETFFKAFFEKGTHLENTLLSQSFVEAIKRQLASFSHFPGFDGATDRTKLIVMRKAGEPSLTRRAEEDNIVQPIPPRPAGSASDQRGETRTVGFSAVPKNLDRPQLTVLQTSDPSRYFRMWEATSRTVRAYCAKHNVGYEGYIGVKRGYWPWQATFNRIVLFQELLARGYSGWVLYLDADAYVADLEFDLRGWLADKHDRSAVLVHGGGTDPWMVNAGVMILNLGHPSAVKLVNAWAERFAAIPDAALRSAEGGAGFWPNGPWPNDQNMLQDILQKDDEITASVFHASTELMNSHTASFIRQHLTAITPDINARTAAIEEEVERILGSHCRSRPAAAKAMRTNLAHFTNEVSQHGEVFFLLRSIVNTAARHRIVVDVGARGRERSNSYDLLRHFGWRGLLIEGNPRLIESIRRDFAGLDCEIINSAVSDHAGKAELYLGINDDVSSLSRARVENWGPASGSVTTDVARLPDLLQKAEIPNDFDLLTIDIEGEDMKVVNDMIDHSGYRPQWIIIEIPPIPEVRSLTELPFSKAVVDAYTLVGRLGPNLLLHYRE